MLSNFKYQRTVFAFFFALWLCLLFFRVYEFATITYANNLSILLPAFLTAFWKDLYFVFIASGVFAIIQLIITWVAPKLQYTTGLFIGIFTVIVCALLTFYSTINAQLLSMESFIAMFSVFNSAAKVIVLAISIVIFSVAFIQIKGFNNIKTIVFIGLVLVGSMFIPTGYNWMHLDNSVKYVGENKLAHFAKSSDIYIHRNFANNQQNTRIAQASLLPSIATSNQENSIKPKTSFIELTTEERHYISLNKDKLLGDNVYNNTKRLAKQGKHFEAISISKALINRNPENVDFHFLLGLTYGWSGNYSKAISQIEYAMQLAPNYTDLYLVLADIHTWNGDISKAINTLEIGKNHVDNPDALHAKKELLI